MQGFGLGEWLAPAVPLKIMASWAPAVVAAFLAAGGMLAWCGPAVAQPVSEKQQTEHLPGTQAAPPGAAGSMPATRPGGFSARAKGGLDEPNVVRAPPRINMEIHFGPRSATVTPRAIPYLDALGNALVGEPLKGYRFRIVGPADAMGSAAYNLALSKRRADAIRRYIISRFKIESHRLEAIGYGEEQSNVPAEPARPRNQHVQVINLGAIK